MLLLPSVITHAEVPHVLSLFTQTLHQAAAHELSSRVWLGNLVVAAA